VRFRVTKNTITLLGGALALIVLSFGSIIWLERALVQGANRVLNGKLDELSDGQRIARRRDMARNLLEEDQSRLRYLEVGVSDKAYVPTLLKQIEELGAATQHRVLGVRPRTDRQGPSRLQQRRDPESQVSGGGVPAGAAPPGAEGEGEPPPEPYTRLPIEISIVGTYRTAQDLVARLTRFPKIVSVDELQLSPHRALDNRVPSGSSLLDVKIQVTAFVMKEKPADAPVVKTASAAIGGNVP
jgi:hypothetical protein